MISVDVTTGKVTLWDGKWCGSAGKIDSSPTFSPKSNSLASAIEGAIKDIRSSNLSEDIMKAAIRNLQGGNFVANTPGSGALKNSISIKFALACRALVEEVNGWRV